MAWLNLRFEIGLMFAALAPTLFDVMAERRQSDFRRDCRGFGSTRSLTTSEKEELRHLALAKGSREYRARNRIEPTAEEVQAREAERAAAKTKRANYIRDRCARESEYAERLRIARKKYDQRYWEKKQGRI